MPLQTETLRIITPLSPVSIKPLEIRFSLSATAVVLILETFVVLFWATLHASDWRTESIFAESFHVESKYDWAQPSWFNDGLGLSQKQGSEQRTWGRMRNLSIELSASGKRGFSFGGSYCSLRGSWNWIPSWWGRGRRTGTTQIKG